ncbi:hypothetical protein MVLG_00205 [Microbotryum lychnidis-dioicae p1A1 Lamole]|uniref:Uncharacterized protein n=1 Tax=Microbotryum lychnidis-dioicae (strain p1A1 Lamole / MvSl-1064) TaxID=683840 RepID=U5GYD7_USTV1|nr:hypothetical protein MVLG_00205 [Microbotryum lychnidis-dioicae p1A1 Lamole]|eukprot:KDE09806.1 hypothetical protein MVLG_00205 [Microbotryum lychnidis-dioicae p1A1 Lamole]
MSFRRGNLIFSGLGLIFPPLNILFLPRASQLALITLGFTRTGVRVTAISVIITFLLLFRAPFEFQIVELLRTARILFVYDHLFSLVICGFIQVFLKIVFVAVFVRPSAPNSRSISSALSSSTAIGIA